MKTCKKCNTVKELIEFNINRSRKDGLDDLCKPCHRAKNKAAKEKRTAEQIARDNAKSKAFRKNNPDKIAIYRATGRPRKLERMAERYEQSPEVRARIKESNAKRRREKPEEMNAANKEWRIKNIESSRLYHRNYTAHKRATDPVWHARELENKTVWRHRNWHKATIGEGWVKEIEDRPISQETIRKLHAWQSDYCYICNRPMLNVTIEHLIPRKRGGPGCEQNLVLTCESCNFSRQDKILHFEWSRNAEPCADRLFLKPKTIKMALEEEGISASLTENGSWILKSSVGKEREMFIISTFFGSSRNPASMNGKIASHVQKHYNEPIILFDYEWHGRRLACLNMIKAKLGISVRGFGARSLNLVSVPHNDACQFLDRHHVMGKTTAPVRIGLVNDGELYGIGLFLDNQDHWECARLAFRGHVPGGMSKIMKHLWKIYGSRPVRSFVDSRYADGAGHETIGFKNLGASPESYQWVFPDKVRHQRFLSNDNKMSMNLIYFKPDAGREDNILANGVYKLWTPPRHIILLEP